MDNSIVLIRETVPRPHQRGQANRTNIEQNTHTHAHTHTHTHIGHNPRPASPNPARGLRLSTLLAVRPLGYDMPASKCSDIIANFLKMCAVSRIKRTNGRHSAGDVLLNLLHYDKCEWDCTRNCASPSRPPELRSFALLRDVTSRFVGRLQSLL